MSDKQEAEMKKRSKHRHIRPEQFLMIGNSIKSDILPVLAIGGHGIHIPYHTTWAHEKVEHTIEHPHFRNIKGAKDLLPFLLS